MNTPAMLPKGSLVFVLGSPEYVQSQLIRLYRQGLNRNSVINPTQSNIKTPSDIHRLLALGSLVQKTSSVLVVSGQLNQLMLTAFANSSRAAKYSVVGVVEPGYSGPMPSTDFDTQLPIIQPNGFSAEYINNPVDVIADVHGCLNTLKSLLIAKGYKFDFEGNLLSPNNRIPVFVGDTVDKGPQSSETLQWLHKNHLQGRILMVMGNHEHKLSRVLSQTSNRPLRYADKAYQTLKELTEDVGPTKVAEIAKWISSLPSQLILHGGKLVISHAGVPQKYIGVDSKAAAKAAMFGDASAYKTGTERTETTWETEYEGSALQVHGHSTTRAPYLIKNHNGGAVVSLDIGVDEGNGLAVFSYPEKSFYIEPTQKN